MRALFPASSSAASASPSASGTALRGRLTAGGASATASPIPTSAAEESKAAALCLRFLGTANHPVAAPRHDVADARPRLLIDASALRHAKVRLKPCFRPRLLQAPALYDDERQRKSAYGTCKGQPRHVRAQLIAQSVCLPTYCCDRLQVKKVRN